jgi:hypothetical protein
LAENNLDGAGGSSSAPGSQPANAEELLAELVRLVESSALASRRSPPPAPSSKPSQTSVDVVPPRTESHNSYANDPNLTNLATGRRAGAWKFTVSALVLVGAAVLGSIFWLRGGESGPPSAASFIARTQGPTTTQPQTDSTAAASSDAGAALGAIPQPAQAKVANPNDQPIDLSAHLSLNNPPHSDLAPTAIGSAQPTADASAGKPPAAPVNTSAVAAPIAAPQPVASQSLEPKPVPTVSVPPGSTQIATQTASTADPGVTARSPDAPLPPVRPAPKPAIEAAGVAHRPTSKLDLPTKLSSKSDARVVVAKAEATGAKAPPERSEPPQREASVKPEKGAKTQAPTEAQAAAPSQQPVAAQQPSPNPVVRTFKDMVGALTGFIPFMPH